MKSFLLAVLVIVSVGCGSTEQPSAKSEPFTGVISASQLIAEYPQFRSGYQQYQPSSAEIAAVKSLSGKSLIVLFGTWCHDSEREVPRLLKLLDLSGVELQNLSLHGVNYSKQEPSNLHELHALKYSPTIILMQGENELGRIVEKPIVSLGEDLAGFVSE
ncbi:thioredoxin [uncultured Paraglaciecola sp.]|uniref:thioredoxin n=1 Tax=uncultured Paraglaciecola sp. TaxID=1765024 RepID=UPI0030D92B0B|tara:strand:- start:54004 stop:54483 length:480 start_codon:yes stop_codon:yes gene_type:complete